ncbi:hypothetical protein Btru_071425 [Bulinus truncatus]|nr:hypothetical protein Btru_071425 [Bulinus truncatus]
MGTCVVVQGIDLNKHLCPKTGEPCTGSHSNKGGTSELDIEVNGNWWFRPTSLKDLAIILKGNQEKKITMIFGNTSSGIFKDEECVDIFIDLHRIQEIYSYEQTETGAKFGAATSVTSLMTKLKADQDKTGFGYFAAFYKHLKFVGNVMVRNAGSVAGNRMMKYLHPDFPSDIFTVMESLGAHVEIFDAATSEFSIYSMLDFLQKVDMTGKVIVSFELPKLAYGVLFKSFKITPRWQNAHAYVNAAFRLNVEGRDIKGRPSFVYGGINAQTVHANKTEEFLSGKTLTVVVVQEALKILADELNPEFDQILASPKYRKDLSVALLYKVLLGLYHPVDPKLRSGSENIHRPISTGLQTYQEMKTEFPLKQPMPKLTAPLQASGEAVFVNDIPTYQNELCAAFVLSDVAPATLESMDTSEALKMPGVYGFYSAQDIPEGSLTISLQGQSSILNQQREIFFSGQTLGMILAGTQSQAYAAVKKVKVNYSQIGKPVLSIEESMTSGKEFNVQLNDFILGDVDSAFQSAEQIIEGQCRMGSQYDFYLETQVSLAVPTEDGIDLYTATQLADTNQHAAANVIGKPLNYINLTVPRVGGGFGGKAWDSCPVAAASTLGAFLTGRPVRMSLDLSTNMKQCGKRAPILAKYKVGFNNTGAVQAIELELYGDMGYSDGRASDLRPITFFIDMCYFVPNWKIHLHPMMTNKQMMSPTRAPSSVPASFIIETIMEHVAKTVNKHPIMVKELNLYERHQVDIRGHNMTNCTIRDLWRRLKDISEVEGRIRQVEVFNQDNLWKKRGITMTGCKYGMSYFGTGQTSNVSI